MQGEAAYQVVPGDVSRNLRTGHDVKLRAFGRGLAAATSDAHVKRLTLGMDKTTYSASVLGPCSWINVERVLSHKRVTCCNCSRHALVNSGVPQGERSSGSLASAWSMGKQQIRKPTVVQATAGKAPKISGRMCRCQSSLLAALSWSPCVDRKSCQARS